MSVAVIVLAVVCLAYANGANDNFKGVATLYGTGTSSYRGALAWATVTTLAGSLAAILLAEQLLQTFSGKGLVPDNLASNVDYAAATALGAGLTVLLATRIGMPISTTHGLVGALIGAGWAAGATVDFAKLGTTFFLPLLVSPLVAMAAAVVCYPLLRLGRQWLGVTEETCLCVGREVIEIVPAGGCAAVMQKVEQLSARLDSEVVCRSRYRGHVLGIPAAATLDQLHYLSAGIVSFARGLNDTPKIAALLLLVGSIGGLGSTAIVGIVIAVGGLLSARKVAETMSNKITTMSHGQGFTANLITGLIVIGASRLGLPVSTTHVSCGSLFGIGAVTRQARLATIGKILVAWVTTLPLGAALGYAAYWVTRQL
ncbi:MAG: inorganic phosphate transporter [Planctomycetaceae bacterium]